MVRLPNFTTLAITVTAVLGAGGCSTFRHPALTGSEEFAVSALHATEVVARVVRAALPTADPHPQHAGAPFWRRDTGHVVSYGHRAEDGALIATGNARVWRNANRHLRMTAWSGPNPVARPVVQAIVVPDGPSDCTVCVTVAPRHPGLRDRILSALGDRVLEGYRLADAKARRSHTERALVDAARRRAARRTQAPGQVGQRARWAQRLRRVSMAWDARRCADRARDQLRRGDHIGATYWVGRAAAQGLAIAPRHQLQARIAHAKRDADAAYGHELARLEQLGPEPTVVLALHDACVRRGRPEEALRWLAHHWDALDDLRPAAEARLARSAARTGATLAARILGSERHPELGLARLSGGEHDPSHDALAAALHLASRHTTPATPSPATTWPTTTRPATAEATGANTAGTAAAPPR